jgi:hypothetical protein
MAIRRASAVSRRATDLVGVATPQETSFVLAALQFAVLQNARGDAGLLRAGAALAVIGATQHHDWRPRRDVTDAYYRSSAIDKGCHTAILADLLPR